LALEVRALGRGAEIMTDGPAEVLVISAELSELARVRQWVKGLLADLDEDLLIDALSVVDELTSNALRHSRAPYRVRLHRGDDTLRVEVADGSTDPVTPRTPDLDGGRGLRLVKAFSLGWGQEIHPDGKIVWAELTMTADSNVPAQQAVNASVS
jgi:anti-sigma regulatory factor (Ser/Thr protein kinase)